MQAVIDGTPAGSWPMTKISDKADLSSNLVHKMGDVKSGALELREAVDKNKLTV